MRENFASTSLILSHTKVHTLSTLHNSPYTREILRSRQSSTAKRAVRVGNPIATHLNVAKKNTLEKFRGLYLASVICKIRQRVTLLGSQAVHLKSVCVTRAKEIRFAHVNVALGVANTNSKVDRTFNKSAALGGSPSSEPAGNARRRLIILTPTAFCALSEFMEVMTGGDD